MLILEIALGIILAALVLRHWPLLLGLVINAANAIVSMGIVIAAIVLVVAYPRLIYAIGTMILMLAFLVLASYLRTYFQSNYVRLPPWFRRTLERIGRVRWALLLFSVFLALILWLAVLAACAWWMGASTEHGRGLESTIAGSNLAALFILPPILFGLLIYRLPWPELPLLKANKGSG